VLSSPANVLLIHITGQDKPGLTCSLMRILADYGVRILDIGQAVIHDALALGILIELTESVRSSHLLATFLMAAHELNMQVRFTAVSDTEYASWVGAQKKRRFIATILGRTISAVQLADVTGVIAGAGINIDRIDRLSGRTPLTPLENSRACVEFLLSSGQDADENRIREQFMALTQVHDVDIAFQHDNVYRRTRRVVAFDMDSTLIQIEVIDELAKVAGVGEQVAKITESAMRGEIDFPAAFRKRVSLLRGLSESSLAQVAERIPLTDGAERLMSTLRRLGYKTAILSGGFSYFGKKLQEKLGFDYLYANELDIRDGAVTGEINSEIVDGQVKARRLREIAAKENISLEQCIAVGDGANDLPMIGLAGLGIAFRAKPIVRETARQAISTLGLDGILYLIGVRDRDIADEFHP
jgi:phosphoserine phosphatase